MKLLVQYLKKRRHRSLLKAVEGQSIYVQLTRYARFHKKQNIQELDYRRRVVHKMQLITANIDAFERLRTEVRRHLKDRSEYCHRIIGMDLPQNTLDMDTWTIDEHGFGVNTKYVSEMLIEESLWLTNTMSKLKEEDIVLHDHVTRSIVPYVTEMVVILNVLIKANL